MTNIEINARKLVEKILNDCIPDKQFTVTVKGEFRGLNYPTGGAKITVDSENIVEFILNRKVLVFHNKLPSSNDYPARPTRFIVSYDEDRAEEFLDTISVRDFSLKLTTGEAKYKENKFKFKPGSKPFNLFKAFLENPKRKFEYEELCKIAGLGDNCGSLEIQELVIKQIRKKLDIPAEHFQAVYGYIFLP